MSSLINSWSFKPFMMMFISIMIFLNFSLIQQYFYLWQSFWLFILKYKFWLFSSVDQVPSGFSYWAGPRRLLRLLSAEYECPSVSLSSLWISKLKLVGSVHTLEIIILWIFEKSDICKKSSDIKRGISSVTFCIGNTIIL